MQHIQTDNPVQELSALVEKKHRRIVKELIGSKTTGGRPLDQNSTAVHLVMEIMAIAISEADKTEIKKEVRDAFLKMALLARKANGVLEGQADNIRTIDQLDNFIREIGLEILS